MKIESIKIENYKIFQNAEAKNLPDMAVFLGKTGAVKPPFLMFSDFCTTV